jgi:hypothetical protein
MPIATSAGYPKNCHDCSPDLTLLIVLTTM